jgi:putative phosphoribosyl transferase
MNHSLIDTQVEMPLRDVKVEGHVVVPEGAKSMVLFSHGSGSSRFSPRNNFVAKVLQASQIGTFLFDLLTKEEDTIYQNRFNIDLLTKRLIAVTKWVGEQKQTANLSIGYFGASTGAASALGAAAYLGESIKSVVSRGGRPDLAIPVLAQVKASVLLLVGSLDTQVIELNKEAYRHIVSEKELQIIPGASHLFEEPGKLEQVSTLAANWFNKHL